MFFSYILFLCIYFLLFFMLFYIFYVCYIQHMLPLVSKAFTDAGVAGEIWTCFKIAGLGTEISTKRQRAASNAVRQLFKEGITGLQLHLRPEFCLLRFQLQYVPSQQYPLKVAELHNFQ